MIVPARGDARVVRGSRVSGLDDAVLRVGDFTATRVRQVRRAVSAGSLSVVCSLAGAGCRVPSFLAPGDAGAWRAGTRARAGGAGAFGSRDPAQRREWRKAPSAVTTDRPDDAPGSSVIVSTRDCNLRPVVTGSINGDGRRGNTGDPSATARFSHAAGTATRGHPQWADSDASMGRPRPGTTTPCRPTGRTTSRARSSRTSCSTGPQPRRRCRRTTSAAAPPPGPNTRTTRTRAASPMAPMPGRGAPTAPVTGDGRLRSA